MSKVVKAFQINLGIPYKIHQPAINFDSIKKVEIDAESFSNHEREKILDNAHSEAEEIISNAQEMAKKILNEARQQAEEMRRLLLDQAREQGYKEGYEEITMKAESILKEAEEIRRNAQEEYTALLESAEKDIVNIVLDIARKIIGDELNSRPETVGNIVRETLLNCKGVERVLIRVSAEDYDIIRSNADVILRQSGYSGEVEIKKDLSLNKGDCIIESPAGIIDSSVEVQLKAIEEAFYDLLNQGKE
ncbi:MAG: flagellar assembly protein FliH [Petroclostridium sp.]|uniref:FliH/SctL family protein n=1 Tax=Petroclostridium xylanilyticum TaxID=1792311 RepID=UPI000B997295|nr:FliH/SctL family protein [Petroclostridium xylanilyticum]MBZ4645856.1 yscL [Clostridia bacterium]MDK2809342.1 flagellar assembly protein FliH [Petroclostridium sp.]